MMSWCNILLQGEGKCTLMPTQTEPVSLPSRFQQSPLHTHRHASPLGSNELQRKQGEETLAPVGWTRCIKILERDLWPVSTASSRQTALCKQRAFHLHPPGWYNGWQGEAMMPQSLCIICDLSNKQKMIIHTTEISPSHAHTTTST